jgi:mannose-6-phosphate isomerase-like protein (cupin superfamily)
VSAVPAGGTDAERETLGPSTGFAALRQAVLTCAPGRSLHRAAGDNAEEVLFVLRGRGTLVLAGERYELEPESGAYLAPGEHYELSNPGPDDLRLVSVAVPDPDADAEVGERAVVRRLADQEAQAATTEREFRIVADPESGLRSATHFVGYIPSARAPEHFHTYDEVIYVLEGDGVFTAGEVRERLEPGSCIQLPARAVHCLENTGAGVMRVLAVFRPAGSPAAAYYPDGTPAYGDAPPIQTS